MAIDIHQLKYYIALGAPPIRTPVNGDEPFMRPEVGFNPSWFHEHCRVDFSQRWHDDPEYRRQCHEVMADEIKRRFPGCNIGDVLSGDPPDLVTGMYGIGILDRIFGRTLRYFPDRWPIPTGDNLTEREVDELTVPDLANNAFFQSLLAQCDRIQQLTGSARGCLNWQGVLNTAFRLRGQDVFSDMALAPERARHLFQVVTDTMIEAASSFLAKQRACGASYQFVTVANCTVNMAGPAMYEEYLLPCDLRIRRCFKDFGIHNCAWSVTPYLDLYARVPRLGYLDMGIESDLEKARRLFPETRRNVLYKSTDLKHRTDDEIRCDFERIAAELAPCDVGLPDIETDVPDSRIVFAMDLCQTLSEQCVLKFDAGDRPRS